MEKTGVYANKLLKEGKVTESQVASAGKLLNTDVGLLTVENTRYLYEVGVIDRKGRILHKPINNSQFNRPVQLWSMFCLIKKDITDTLGLSDLNAIVDVMREGQLDSEKRYPRVSNFVQKGTQLAIEAITKKSRGSRSRKDDLSFADL